MKQPELSNVFVSPSGRLCKHIVLFGKIRSTLIDVEPSPFWNISNLTVPEIEDLKPEDIGFSENPQSLKSIRYRIHYGRR